MKPLLDLFIASLTINQSSYYLLKMYYNIIMDQNYKYPKEETFLAEH